MVCDKNTNLDYQFEEYDHYKVFFAHISINEKLIINGKIISFYEKSSLGIEGRLVTTSRASDKTTSYDIFNSVESISISNITDAVKYIQINGKNYYIGNLNQSTRYINNSKILDITFDNSLADGFYTLVLLNIKEKN